MFRSILYGITITAECQGSPHVWMVRGTRASGPRGGFGILSKRDRFQEKSTGPESVTFWPLTDDEAAGKGASVLSGNYVRDWSIIGQNMAEQGRNSNPFTGRPTLASFWSDSNCRPMDLFDRIETPVLWAMATNNVVCGPLDFTKGVYEKLKGPRKVYVLERNTFLAACRVQQ